MPLYIVRWPNLSASLIQADDEDHLQDLLDEIGDPGAAIWEEYDGPVWIEFEPKRRETADGGFEIVDDFDSETGSWDILRPRVAETATGMDMYWQMLERLFPHLEVALRETAGSDLETDRVKAILNRAIEREDWHGTATAERWQRYARTNTIMGNARLTGAAQVPRQRLAARARRGQERRPRRQRWRSRRSAGRCRGCR